MGESVKKDTDEYVFSDIKLEFNKMAASKRKKTNRFVFKRI